MIEIVLLPSSGPKIPRTATIDSQMASVLSGVSTSTDSEIDSWHDVRRIIPGSERQLRLRVDAAVSETTRDNIVSAITTEFALEPHPDGWVSVDK